MKVFVVHKVPKLTDLQSSAPAMIADLAELDPGQLASMEDARDIQNRALETVVETLDQQGRLLGVVNRNDFDVVPPEADLVLAVGGDGTVLDVSHRVIDRPLAAINSDPKRSVGYFCASDASGVGKVVDAAESGAAEVFELHRFQLSLNDEPLPFPCMNDVLVTNGNPAMMSRYVLHAGTRNEKQSSSGLWVSTPAGSTGGIRSAGGTVMPLEGSLLQYLVREPYMPRHIHFELTRGVRHLREGLAIESLMTDGRIYVDGPYIEYEFLIGSVLRFSEGPPLRILGLEPHLRER